MGSSPRGRGKRVDTTTVIVCNGLIPARAGKTRSPGNFALKKKAHPRAGGENIAGDYDRYREWGSSPRGRGKQNWRL